MSRLCEIKCPNLSLIFANGYLNKYVRICVQKNTVQNPGLDVRVCVTVFCVGNRAKYLEVLVCFVFDLQSFRKNYADLTAVLWNDGWDWGNYHKIAKHLIQVCELV